MLSNICVPFYNFWKHYHYSTHILSTPYFVLTHSHYSLSISNFSSLLPHENIPYSSIIELKLPHTFSTSVCHLTLAIYLAQSPCSNEINIHQLVIYQCIHYNKKYINNFQFSNRLTLLYCLFIKKKGVQLNPKKEGGLLFVGR